MPFCVRFIPSSVHIYRLTSKLSRNLFSFFFKAPKYSSRSASSRSRGLIFSSAPLSLANTWRLPSSHGAAANAPWQISQLARCLRSSRYHAPSSSSTAAAAELCCVSPTRRGWEGRGGGVGGAALEYLGLAFLPGIEKREPSAGELFCHILLRFCLHIFNAKTSRKRTLV